MAAHRCVVASGRSLTRFRVRSLPVLSSAFRCTTLPGGYLVTTISSIATRRWPGVARTSISSVCAPAVFQDAL